MVRDRNVGSTKAVYETRGKNCLFEDCGIRGKLRLSVRSVQRHIRDAGRRRLICPVSLFYDAPTWLLSSVYCLLVAHFVSVRTVQASWNVMAHEQKPDSVFRQNGRVHLNRRGRQFSRLLAAEVCASAVVIAVMLDTPCPSWCEEYPLHSPVSPSLPPPCVTLCHHISTGMYVRFTTPLYDEMLKLIF